MPPEASTEVTDEAVERLTALIAETNLSVYYGAAGDQLASQIDLAKHFGVSRTAVHQWIARRERNGFPAAACTTAGGLDLWFVSEVAFWRENYVPAVGRTTVRVAGHTA